MSKKLSHALEITTFQVDFLAEGDIALARLAGDLVPLEVLEDLHTWIGVTIEQMKSTGKDQKTLLIELEHTANDVELMPAHWSFPKTMPGPGKLIYFVYSPDLDAIKIGATSNLSQRLRVIAAKSADLDRDRFEVLSVIRTDRKEQMETTIHMQLVPFLFDGEWFQKEAVIDFINLHANVTLPVPPTPSDLETVKKKRSHLTSHNGWTSVRAN